MIKVRKLDEWAAKKYHKSPPEKAFFWLDVWTSIRRQNISRHLFNQVMEA